MRKIQQLVILLLYVFFSTSVFAQTVQVGANGSYTKSFPGVDEANRNGYPSGTPQLSGKAVGKPVPTNDWWSSLLKEDHPFNLFNYPFTLKTVNEGLVVSYIPWGVIDDLLPVTVGVTGMNATKTTVSDYSDWTVSINWNDGTHSFEAVSGVGMPFLYFTKKSSDQAQVKITSGTVKIIEEIIVIKDAKNGADFAIYAPKGSSWTKEGEIYTSSLNGKNYWSLAFLPSEVANTEEAAKSYQQYAYVFPTDTRAEWSYNEATATVRTEFIVDTEVKEGADNKMLLGLLPHQWANLASDSPTPEGFSYASIRGEMKTLAGNTFAVENKFHGILSTLPYVDEYSPGFSADQLNTKVELLQDEELARWTDSYNEGQVMNRLVQTARIAHEIGNLTARDKILDTIKERLEDWLSYKPGEVAFLFYYNSDWTALLGYPAGHGQDTNLNDHHFHWAYFIHAAAFIELYEPGWAKKWGDMVDLLVRDAASADRNDTLFPYLRNFSPYAGHCWANGFATFPQGNDQESTSESMQFNSSLIHWGTLTGNKEIRDLGIYLYTTEQTAIEEYWFDVYERNFPSTQMYSLVSRIWGNSFDNGTFWTNDIEASYGIELYPIHGGSLYLGHNIDYVEKLSAEIKRNTGIMGNDANVNLWHDIMWEYFAFIDPTEAIGLYNSYPDRSLKFGVSDAQTYHWLHAMNALGQVDATVTADYPIAVAFNLNGMLSYVAHNYTNNPLTVTFSTGYELEVPAREMAVGKAGSAMPVVAITSPSNNSKYGPGEEIVITASAIDYGEKNIEKVEFFQNGILINTVLTAPYTIKWNPAEGVYALTAKATNEDGDVGTSRAVNITVTGSGPCSETSQEASQGDFQKGYTVSFETIGTSVNIIFELLDDNREGVVAYLWEMEPFAEMSMKDMGGQRFSASLNGQTPGEEIQIACKFAYAGGMSVTKVFSYVVGTNCATDGIDTPVVENIIKVYPNPFYEEIILTAEENISQVVIYNIMGQKVGGIGGIDGKELSIDLSYLQKGNYFVKVIFENRESIVRKLSKI